jgi:LicD family
MLTWLRSMRPSRRPGFLMMPSWFATPFVENLLCVLSALDHFGFKYIAHKGLLLGAVRLRGVLPWDDDCDVFLVDEAAADVATRLGPVLEQVGIRLTFRETGYYFEATPRIPFPFGYYSLTEIGLLTRSESPGGAVYDAHEPGRMLAHHEVLPLLRIPFYGTYVMGPARAEVAIERMYGSLASRDEMARFAAPHIDEEARVFWSEARPIDGELDWPRIRERMQHRNNSPGLLWRHSMRWAWFISNRSYWIGIDLIRMAAGGRRGLS